MKTVTMLSRKVPALFALLIVSQQVFAGNGVGSISHEPTANAVPLLGGAGLIVLSALLGLLSLRFLKERGRSGSFLIVAAMAGAVASAGGGLKLISDAEAQFNGIQLTELSGGKITIPFEGFNSVINAAGTAQEITRISLNEGCELQVFRVMSLGNGGNGGNGGTFRGACDDKPGTVLQPGDFCDISVCCDGPNGGNGGGCFDEK
ncbi:MAG: hypothetical protein ACI9NT_000801 [Bacteroidia bacterium]|jgi:hypothetical protein